MASIEHDTRKKPAPTGSSSRFLPLIAAAVVILLAGAWIFSAITDAEPVGLGYGVVSDADPVIVTETANDAVAAPLSSEAQGATRTTLGDTPADLD